MANSNWLVEIKYSIWCRKCDSYLKVTCKELDEATNLEQTFKEQHAHDQEHL